MSSRRGRAILGDQDAPAGAVARLSGSPIPTFLNEGRGSAIRQEQTAISSVN